VAGDDALLTEIEAAALLRVAPRTLRRWRAEGIGPPAIRVGHGRGRIRYRRSAIEQWLAQPDRQVGPPPEPST
jgi:excisionase family DNA binding protein